MQSAAVMFGSATVQLKLPAASDDVMPGVRWGAVEAFPSPAYWTYQVLARRIEGTSIRYRLGDTLAEEVGACLLGGHGIPAHIGVEAFHQLKAHSVFDKITPEEEVYSLLSAPIRVDGKEVRYRFARQKSKYISAALKKLFSEKAPIKSGHELRDWLLDIPGIGLKTASWVARNWLDADDVAILDIHLLRAGAIGGFFTDGLTVEKNYRELEGEFLHFSQALGVRASELDAVIWLEMMSSPSSVRLLLSGKVSEDKAVSPSVEASFPRTDPSCADSHQTGLFD